MDQALTLPWLIVATPQLQDPNFNRTVVLIVEHGDHGSMGFVINRPLRMPLSDLVESPQLPIPANIPAWYGGPVATESGIILHNRASDARPGASAAAGNDRTAVALSSSAETLSELVAYGMARTRELEALPPGAVDESRLVDGLYPYRFLVGYAGWAEGQLTEELHQGAWIQMPATVRLIFDTPWRSLWQTALQTVGVNPRILAPSAHPFLN